MRILIAEDDAVSRRLLEATLQKWGYEVVVCSDGEQAWEVLQNDSGPQLAILDWMMPGIDGVELCRRVRKKAQEPYVYILLLTAKKGREDFVIGLEAGADDYLTKPFDQNELKARLRAGRRILDLQAELIVARDSLRVQAQYDGLTGIKNRSAITEVLQRESKRAGRDRSPVSVVMVDIDKFKDVNDTYGHMCGDAVLCKIARRMRASLRVYDDIGRYGGEEFLIVLPGCSESEGVVVAERIREVISGEPMDTPDGMVPVTVSLGVATSVADIPPVEELVRNADDALYCAKKAGRNCVITACSPQTAGYSG